MFSRVRDGLAELPSGRQLLQQGDRLVARYIPTDADYETVRCETPRRQRPDRFEPDRNSGLGRRERVSSQSPLELDLRLEASAGDTRRRRGKPWSGPEVTERRSFHAWVPQKVDHHADRLLPILGKNFHGEREAVDVELGVELRAKGFEPERQGR